MEFVVERYLPGVDQDVLERGLRRLGRVTQAMRNEGLAVRYLGSTFVPGDEACLSRFRAGSSELVAEAHRRADLPFDRIVRSETLGGEHTGTSQELR